MEKITHTNPKKEDIESKERPQTETKEKTSIRVAREAFEALNTGDLSRVH